jgi:hypothetical protein
MSLSEFRAAFHRYAKENNINLPEKFTSASELEFISAINTYLKPHADNMDLCYSNLRTLIIIAEGDAPELTPEQTNKVKRYLQAFIRVTE